MQLINPWQKLLLPRLLSLQNVSNATHHCVAKTLFIATKQKKMWLKVLTTKLFATAANDHHVVAL